MWEVVPDIEENILSIHCGEDNQIWYSTEQGLWSFEPKSGRKKLLFSDAQTKITSIYQEKTSDVLWLGTLGEGVWRLNLRNGEKKRFQEKDGFVNNHVMSIDGNEDEIWFATFGGVSRLRQSVGNSTFENINSKNGLGSDYVYKAIVDKNGTAWFATDGKGIYYYQDETLKAANQASQKTVLSIAETNDGKVWFSTEDGKICFFDGEKFKSFPKYQPKNSFAPVSVMSNTENDLIISYPEYIDILFVQTGEFIRFDASMGISPLGQDLNVVDRDPEGNIWIGTNQGIMRLNPPVNQPKVYPQPRIRKVKVGLEDIDEIGPMKLSHDQNHLVFDFIGIWYQSPESVHYEYRLNGYDNKWIPTRDNQAIFPKLRHGYYKFELRASSGLNNSWSPPASFRFRIHKPFWETWWFILSVGLTIFGVTSWWVKSREERLRLAEKLEKDKLESRFETLQSQINPHFLFNSFNTLISIIEDDKSTAVEYVEKLSDFFRNILAYRDRQIIPLKEELTLFDDFHYLQKKRYGDNFRLVIEINPELLAKGIPTLTLQLLVENAFKHNIISATRPLHIYVETKIPGYLTVRNNLQRRKYEVPSTRIGLENIAQRYQILTQKEVKIEISDGEFAVHIPLLNEELL